MDIMKLMMYILLDNSPTKFLECCQDAETFCIRSFRWPASLSAFLERTMYPPIENKVNVGIVLLAKAQKGCVEIPVMSILKRREELSELDKRLSHIYPSSEVCDEILGIA